MLVALLLTIPTLGQAHPLDAEPAFSSIVLTEGVTGGIVGPMLRRRVEVGHDWENGVYRVTVFDGRGPVGEEYRTGVVSRAWFEDLLAAVLEKGLDRLRPQTDPDASDVYGLNTTVTLFHGDRFWTNAVAGGCNQREVFRPTAGERQAFADVVRAIDERAAAAADEPGCILDSGFPAQVSGKHEERALLAALEHALRGPSSRSIDRRQIGFRCDGDRYEVRFRWRDTQDTDWLRNAPYTVVVDAATLATTSHSADAPPGPSERDLSRRHAYLAANPTLPAPFRRLIAEGWIWPGMTKEMVAAARGVDGEPRRHGDVSYDDEGELIRRWPFRSGWPRRERIDGPRAGRPFSQLRR